MATKKPLVSVVIPTWNRRDDLDRTLKSVFRQSYPNFEVIVVDNGSTDGSVKLVRKKFPKVKLIANPKNLGTSIAKNQGIVASKGSFIHFLDSDIEFVKKDCMATMVRLLYEHPGIGALGGEAYKLPGNRVETKKKMITFNCETSTIVMKSKKYRLEDCGYVATCNCMMPRHLLWKCKGFDSKIIYAGEDKEMGIKLRKQGSRSVVDSRCLVYHYISQSTGHRNFYPFNKNRIRIVIRNYDIFRIIFLPLLDIISAFSPKKFRDIRGGNVDITKWHKAKKKENFLLKVVKVGSSYVGSLVAAYAWNILHFPITVAERIRGINHLELDYGNR